MRSSLALAAVLLAGAGGPAPPLTPTQRRIADALVSEFENSTPTPQYCYVAALGDGRGYTVGRAGFTSATGDLLEVVERYTAAEPGNRLARFLPRLRALARSGSASLRGLEGLPAAWRATCRDARQRAAQAAVVDREYLAVRRADLLHPADAATRAEWAQSVDRVAVWAYLVRTGQWSPHPPVVVRTADYRLRLH